MDNNMTALAKIYVALGGKLTDYYDDIADGAPVSDYSINPDMISAIAKVLPGALAGVLPAVTATDNGSVLKVVDGKWAVGTDEITG